MHLDLLSIPQSGGKNVKTCCCCFSHSAHWLPTRKKLLCTVANPARGLLNKEKKKKKKVWRRPPPPPPRAARSDKKNKKKIKIKITRCINMFRRYASRRYADGLGPSRVRTRIPTTRQLGQWVSLRKILRFRVRLQLSQSRCLSLEKTETRTYCTSRQQYKMGYLLFEGFRRASQESGLA